MQNSCARGTLGSGAKQLRTRNTRVKLDEPSMCRHGLGTHETERSIMNHIVDMISIGMLTTETTLDSRDDRTWDSVSGS